jgi:hypothetical protein
MAQAAALLSRASAQNVAAIEHAASAVAPVITTVALPPGRVGVPYSQTIQATGSPAPTASLASGTLPPGLALTAATRRIAGTPTAPVKAAFEVQVTNAAGSDTKALSIIVPNESIGAAIVLPMPTTLTLAPAAADVLPGDTVDLLLTIEDQSEAAIANLVGAVVVENAHATAAQLAPTDTIGQATVRVTGVSAGSCGVYVEVDGVRGNSTAVTVLDAVAPTITTTSLPDAIIGQPYSVQLQASGSPTVAWSIDSGSLPAGLALSSNGALSGTATGSQTAVFVVRAANAYGADTQALTLVARVAISITQVTVTPATATIAPGAQTQLQAAVVGVGAFDPTVTWSVRSGGGAVSPTGLYTAPPAPTTAVVRATSVQDATKFDEATITVQAPAQADSIRAAGIRCGLYQGSTLLMPVRITVTQGSAAGQTITASSSDPTKVAVSPSASITDDQGKTVFTLSFLAGGQSTITFSSGPMTTEMLAITRVGGGQ